MVWLVGFGCVEIGSDWLSQAGTHCVAQAIRSFVLFLLFSAFWEEAVNSSINLVCVFFKKKKSSKEGSQALWFISQGSLTNVDVQDKFNKKLNV